MVMLSNKHADYHVDVNRDEEGHPTAIVSPNSDCPYCQPTSAYHALGLCGDISTKLGLRCTRERGHRDKRSWHKAFVPESWETEYWS